MPVGSLLSGHPPSLQRLPELSQYTIYGRVYADAVTPGARDFDNRTPRGLLWGCHAVGMCCISKSCQPLPALAGSQLTAKIEKCTF